jgi:uncharacterized membrane protein YuzA (DUF378 family)
MGLSTLHKGVVFVYNDSHMQKESKNYFKIVLGLLICLMVRLIPVRVPNVEPILATAMPFSKAYGAFTAFYFGVLSILLYDLVTGMLGVRTIFTAGAYGLVGLWSAYFFQKREANVANFVRFAIVGTLVYDALTGLTVGPLFFHQSFFASLVGQIPFTALHLVGNIIFAILLSPAIYNFLIRKRIKEKIPHLNTLNPKII